MVSLLVSKFSIVVFMVAVADRERCQFAWSAASHSRTALKFEVLFSTLEMFAFFHDGAVFHNSSTLPSTVRCVVKTLALN